MTLGVTLDRLVDALRSLTLHVVARCVLVELSCHECLYHQCASASAMKLMAGQLNGNTSDAMTLTVTLDRLIKTVRSLTLHDVTRCVPIELSCHQLHAVRRGALMVQALMTR